MSTTAVFTHRTHSPQVAWGGRSSNMYVVHVEPSQTRTEDATECLYKIYKTTGWIRGVLAVIVKGTDARGKALLLCP
jgi:hypothetical protein